MERVTKVRALPGFRLEMEFSDGLRGVLDYAGRLKGPVFDAIRDPAKFAEVGIDEFGAVCWPGGPDLAPDAMYARLKRGGFVAR
jgi:hypothetical protein